MMSGQWDVIGKLSPVTCYLWRVTLQVTPELADQKSAGEATFIISEHCQDPGLGPGPGGVGI